MSHVDEGLLQAFRDGELEPTARAAVAAHLADCPDCADQLRELHDLDAFVSGALALLDPPAPVVAVAGRRAGPAARVTARTDSIGIGTALGRDRSMAAGAATRGIPVWRGREVRRTLLKAAVLVVGIAAIGSAAVPGSPVRSWTAAAWQKSAGVMRPAAQREPEPAASPTSSPLQAGIAILPDAGRVHVSVREPQAGVQLRIRMADGARVRVTAVSGPGAPRFRSGPGHLEIVGPGAGDLVIDLPRTLQNAAVEVDGRTVARLESGRIVSPDRPDGVDELTLPLDGTDF